MTLINCDIGEQGAYNDSDRRLMDFIHIANLACEGHAGDRQTIAAFRALALERGVQVAAHLSYPDKENFGRASLKLPEAELLAALDAQLALLPGIDLVKFHGALYNDAWRDPVLAETLAQWLFRSGVQGVLAPADSELSFAVRKLGITVLREAFADRRYAWDAESGRLRLVDRSEPGAVIKDAQEALAQAADLLRGRVNVSMDPAGPVWKEIEAETICLHSDSPIALELARGLREAVDSAAGSCGAGVSGGIRLVKEGVCDIVSLPAYGNQDIGVSPGGAMDCFSLRRGNIMLGNGEGCAALEILAAPEIEFIKPGHFVLTGARHSALLTHGGVRAEAEHSRVYAVEAGDRLALSNKQYGLLTYFCFREACEGAMRAGRPAAVPYSAVSGWTDPKGRIRVLPGPEYDRLENPELFFTNAWRTTYEMDKMGIRLAGEPRLKCGLANMISGAVADGTVQLTPESPIILLRHRQTTGGYPRIFNVISADIDLLGQYAPNQAIHFAQVTPEEARDFARQKEEVLAKLK